MTAEAAVNKALDSKEPTSKESDAKTFVAQVRRNWGVDRATFARMAGITERTIGEWERNKPKEGSNLRAIIELDRLYDALCRVVKPEYIRPWLEITNPAFDPLTPIEVLQRGHIDRVYQMIFEMEIGSAF
jgi:DNA-binding XRE family transcriptional regulator